MLLKEAMRGLLPDEIITARTSAASRSLRGVGAGSAAGLHRGSASGTSPILISPGTASGGTTCAQGRRRSYERAGPYRANYDQIARDHIDHWREHGANPFQDPALLKANEDATVALIEQYSPTATGLDVGCGMGDLLLRFPTASAWGWTIFRDYLADSEGAGTDSLQRQ